MQNTSIIAGCLKLGIAGSAFLVLVGCAAKPLNPEATGVFISNEKPSEECEFVKEIYGGQGNWWTDDITSTKALTEGSRNDLRNQAYAAGANYVHVQQVERNESFAGGGKMAMTGHAYKCP
ncbi:DUF4156 domain-containing protein [Gilvimarinus sp. DA14]|uniref:DUF4156 domain-containing protein n=1 Tax=Gilvimarinus sp. DA14 TaxID=2956798 RepID=UPI0020B6E177|nr:DUF4156 domain-containing protein [Gilvimarinus sp. DA14]UTF60279.1 DUF4156 domain-containing protein [Gilvimarinus sp. DA14]